MKGLNLNNPGPDNYRDQPRDNAYSKASVRETAGFEKRNRLRTEQIIT